MGVFEPDFRFKFNSLLPLRPWNKIIEGVPRTPNSAGPGPCSTVQPRGASIPAITSPEAKIDGKELNIDAAFILKEWTD